MIDLLQNKYKDLIGTTEEFKAPENTESDIDVHPNPKAQSNPSQNNWGPSELSESEFAKCPQ